MSTRSVDERNVKVSRSGPRGKKLTSDEAVSYEPEGCYYLRMRVFKDLAPDLSLPNEDLLKLAAKHSPPAEFFDKDEERPW